MVSKFRAYQGGVERHIEDLMKELGSRGHQVGSFTSEDLESTGGATFTSEPRGVRQKILVARDLLWNQRARDSFRERLRAFSPEIVHFHSIYHQLSPSLLGAFDGPQVMTLHDYKLAAPCYTLIRDGRICTDCVGRSLPIPSVRHRCVGGSVLGSSLCAAEHLIHRRRYESAIDRFIVPSEYARGIMVQAGLDADALATIPWGVAPTDIDRERSALEGIRVVYAGRLHDSKGIMVLLDAWKLVDSRYGARLLIAGGGELGADVTGFADSNARVTYMGVLSSEDARRLIGSADLVVVPSLAAETMGLTALEALRAGVPLISSGSGALAELTGAGVIEVQPIADELARTINGLLSDPGRLSGIRAELAVRDLGTYTVGGMVDRIEAEYLIAQDRKARARSAIS